MIQAPNLPAQYTTPPSMPQQYMPQAPASYNAVKIDVHNPSVNAPGAQQPQYASTTMPYYQYPQAQLYQYPQAQYQPYYMPQAPVQQAPAAQAVTTPAPEAVPPAPVIVPPQVVQQNVNAPAEVVTAAPVQNAEPKKVEVVPPAEMTPQIDLNAFLGKLLNPDFDVQANAMEEIANLVKDTPQKATELLDAKVIDALTQIMNADSSKLAGPTQEQIALRQKLMSGQQLNDTEKASASTITPMEQAERNKSYAIFTTAILQKLYGEEIAKLTNTTVPLTELPGAVTIVDQLKDNPNPMVRTSAIEAMSYIQSPSYKQDLTTLFTVAKNDEDKSVQDAAAAALEKLNQI